MRAHGRVVAIGDLIVLRRHGEQLAGSGEVLGAPAIGGQPVVADAMEAARQDVDEKAAHELLGCEGHDLGPVAALGPVVLPLEGDAVLGEGDQAAVGDRDPVGVAGEIGEYRLRPGERPLGIDDPFGVA